NPPAFVALDSGPAASRAPDQRTQTAPAPRCARSDNLLPLPGRAAAAAARRHGPAVAPKLHPWQSVAPPCCLLPCRGRGCPPSAHQPAPLLPLECSSAPGATV